MKPNPLVSENPDRASTPLASLPPDLTEEELVQVHRFIRVFGTKRLSSYLDHLRSLRTNKPWFVYVDHKGAKFFTRFVRQVSPVKNPRSITGSQKFIARNDNEPAFLF